MLWPIVWVMKHTCLVFNTRNVSRIGIKTWMLRTHCTPWASGARTTSAQITITGGSPRAQGHSVLEVFGQLPKRRNTNMCFLKSCKLEIIPTGEERPGFDHTTFYQIGHYAYTSTQHHQGHLDVGRTCDITGSSRVFFFTVGLP